MRIPKKKTPRRDSFHFFSPKKLVRLFILKEVKPSHDGKMIKLLTFDNLFPPPTTFKILGRITTAITFCHQNDAGSRLVSSTQY